MITCFVIWILLSYHDKSPYSDQTNRKPYNTYVPKVLSTLDLGENQIKV